MVVEEEQLMCPGMCEHGKAFITGGAGGAGSSVREGRIGYDSRAWRLSETSVGCATEQSLLQPHF